MEVDPTTREHLHRAGEAARKAARTASEDLGQRLVSNEVRGHLRSAARHVLQAGLAALDAHEARVARPTTTAVTVSVIPVSPSDPVPFAAPPTAG